MSLPAERASSARAASLAFALALVISCLATPSRAQGPSCAWGDGVTLPVSGERGLLLASDGSAGVLAFTWPWGASPVYYGVVHMFHVLEQGTLDPSLPASGVSVLSGGDLGNQFQLHPLRAIPDGSGGVYLLTRTCDAWAPGLRCWEASEIRLQHVTAQGSPVPGWPANGHVIPYGRTPAPLDAVDIVPDGAGGITAVWLDGTVWNGTYPIMAQRFAADGTPAWPGGTAGLNVLTSPFANRSMRIAGDGQGGFVVVASRLVGSASNQLELVASRATGSGTLAWGASGKAVLLNPNQSMSIRGVSLDVGTGATFVSAALTPTTSGPVQFYTQSLTSQGDRVWGLYGVTIGPTTEYYSSAQLPLPSAFATLHPDGAGAIYLQIQDPFGTPSLGETPAGMPLEGMDPWAVLPPLATEDGNMILVLASGTAPDPPDIRALELDAGASVAPGWPEAGMPVCGAIAGYEFGSAFVGAGHLFVGLTSSVFFETQPRIQRLSRAVLAADDALPARALELAPPRPNPARGAWTANVALREAARVSLEAFDVAGRRVLERDFGVLSPGRHPLPVAGDALAPGVYRVRVRAGIHAAERMLVRTR